MDKGEPHTFEQSGDDNNGQSDAEFISRGELRNGRKSQFKNSNPHGDEAVPNEYVRPL